MDNDIELHRVPSPPASTLITKYSGNGYDQDIVDTARLMPDLEAQEQTSPLFTKLRIRKRFLGPRQQLDELDLLLNSHLLDGNRSHDFIRDWSHFRGRPGSGALFDSLCEYKISHPPVYPSLESVLPEIRVQKGISSFFPPASLSTLHVCNLTVNIQSIPPKHCSLRLSKKACKLFCNGFS